MQAVALISQLLSSKQPEVSSTSDTGRSHFSLNSMLLPTTHAGEMDDMYGNPDDGEDGEYNPFEGEEE